MPRKRHRAAHLWDKRALTGVRIRDGPFGSGTLPWRAGALSRVPPPGPSEAQEEALFLSEILYLVVFDMELQNKSTFDGFY